MDDVKQMLEEQQRELERIRRKRGGNMDTEKVRKVLNILFLLLTAAGALIYFGTGEYKNGLLNSVSLYVWGVALVVKLIEFYIRYMY
ncbi:MAG: hypothetical protein HUK02_03490 [Bacteroidaceae bacterium]|nr:hypothetical protein [Bacteroidaceae bacterium]